MTPNPRPTWRRLRKAIALIKTGVPPQRAFTVSHLPVSLLENQKTANLVSRAEAAFQVSTLRFIREASKDTLKLEYQWQAVAPSQSPPIAVTPSGDVDQSVSAPVRARAFPKPGDWKAAAFLLERRFPSEYGSQQPVQVAETVVSVLSALAALRQQPVSLENLRYRPELPAKLPAKTADPADPADPSEGTGGGTGIP